MIGWRIWAFVGFSMGWMANVPDRVLVRYCLNPFKVTEVYCKAWLEHLMVSIEWLDVLGL